MGRESFSEFGFVVPLGLVVVPVVNSKLEICLILDRAGKCRSVCIGAAIYPSTSRLRRVERLKSLKFTLRIWING